MTTPHSSDGTLADRSKTLPPDARSGHTLTSGNAADDGARPVCVLPDALVDQIAAGEVVERPASVLKELVENALDAGATSICVEIEDGGRRRISVIDDGVGMTPADARLCLRRHATSKITSMQELLTTRTMGFRGEALAAIASVSRLTLVTRRRSSRDATRVIAVDGAEPEILTANAEPGTSVTVEDLFHNVPARRSFLKSAATEARECLELIHALTLSRPDVAIEYRHNGKAQLSAPVAGPRSSATGSEAEFLSALRERAGVVFGSEAATGMIAVSRTSQYGSVIGLVSPPGVERTSGRDMYTFVNARAVRDRLLRFAVLRGYHSHLLRGRFPMVALHVNLDPALVDVNVHPAKTEVRFQYGSELQGLIALAIREGIRSGNWADARPELVAGAQSTVDRSVASPGVFAPSSRLTDTTTSNSDGRRTVMSFDGPARPNTFAARSPGPAPSSGSASTSRAGVPSYAGSPGIAPAALAGSNSRGTLFDEFGDIAASRSTQLAGESGSASEAREARIDFSELIWVGEFGRCFQFFATRGENEQLLVVDQHAFHERIVFERLVRDPDLLRRTQPLLVPESFSMSAAEVDQLRGRGDVLKRCGFSVDIVSDTSLEVRAVPALLAGRDIGAALAALASPLETAIPTEDASGIAHDVLATLACHAAVRSGESLGADERRQLLREAAGVDFYHNCPHGRRVLRWFSRSEVSRWFDR